MPKGKAERYSNENVSIIETRVLNAPVKEDGERRNQGENHGIEVEWTSLRLVYIRFNKWAVVVVLGMTHEQSW